MRIFFLFLFTVCLGNLQAQTPAFPGAEGGGMYAAGGRGGQVYFVNTIEDNSTGNAATREGSLRWCLNQSGTRTIIFKVGGTVFLKSALSIKNGNVTVAGQTAPGGGICIADYPVSVSADNVILRYLRFRMGEANGDDGADALGGRFFKNVIVDHCSVCWSVDECASFYNCDYFTMQWCLVSESLRMSKHSKGSHGYGGIWGGTNATFHHNLMAHHDSRCPRFGPGQNIPPHVETVDFRNNINYNHGNTYGGEGMNINLVNNYYKPGPGSASGTARGRILSLDKDKNEGSIRYNVWGQLYVDGNVVDDGKNNANCINTTNDNWTYGIYNQFHSSYGIVPEADKTAMKMNESFKIYALNNNQKVDSRVTTHDARTAYEKVLDYAGASLNRDSYDNRIIHEVRAGTAAFKGASTNKQGIIDVVEDTKPADAGENWSPWPALDPGATIDYTAGGIPAGWLETHYPGKSAIDVNSEGYTYLEVYLNSLVENITDRQYAGTSTVKTTSVNPATFKAAYEAAEDGEILLMETGNYSPSGINVPTGITVTLKAAEGASPVLNCQIGGTVSNTGGGLIFDSIEINRGLPIADNYFISGDPGNIKILAFKNVTIANIGRCLLRTNTEGYTIDEILFENCIIKNCGTGWNFLYPKHAVKKLTVKNATLYNYTGGESFFCQNATVNTMDLAFLFENNTVYKWSGATNDRAIAKVTNRYGSNSTYIFRNNIVAEHNGDYTPVMIHLTTGGTVTAQNNLIVNYGGYSGGTQTINDLTLEGLGITAIGFPDPDNGDFSIISTSPLATAGVGGTCIGDPRWVKTLAQAVNFTSKVLPEEAGTVSPVSASFEKNQQVTITAARNYGYRFKEWRNAAGQTVSTENPYVFTITEDTELTAVFNTLNTYTLTVNKEGDGAEWGRIALNPQPVNGKYEQGEFVTVSVVPNSVSTFLYWENNAGETSRQITMDGDKTLTATFDWIPFLVAWNFDPSEPRNNRPGDFYSRSDNTGIMRFFNGDGSSTNWGGSSKSWGGVSYSCARRYTGYADMNNPRYFQAEFSAKGMEQIRYKNIRITSFIGSDNNCVHKMQKMQYALNPEGPFTDLAVIDMTNYHNTQWVECKAVLPETLTEEDKERIYIRWIGDPGSDLTGTPGATDTEGFYLANVVVYADIEQTDDYDAPRLLSAVPADGTTTASANGSIVLVFDERVKAGTGDGKIEFNGETLTPVFANKTVSYPYKRLSYGTQYTVAIPAGIIVDMSGNSYAGVNITFTTMIRPQPDKRLFDAVVDGSGVDDYTKVQDAINAAPDNRTRPWLIFIKNGRYEELLRIPRSKPFIHLIGESKDRVILTWGIYCSNEVVGWEEMYQANQGVSDACASLVVDASDFYAENISFENRYGVEAKSGPQALAFKNNRDRIAAYNCKFRSFQDTWQTSSGSNDRIYAYDCRIEGAVDYFYNSGNAYVENSTLYNVRSGSVIVAPAHVPDTRYGYVFRNCIVDGNTAAADGQLKLGRPWHNTPKTVYLNTTMKIMPSPEGWTNMGVVPEIFAEYNSMDINGNPIDLSNRKTCYTQSESEGGQTICGVKAVLTAEEAAAYTYEGVINEPDGWNPRAFFETVLKPAQINMPSNTLSWNECDYAICYAVYKNGRVIAFTTAATYEDITAGDTDVYSVRPVNEYGSLGEMSNPIQKGNVGFKNPETAGKKYVFEKTDNELVIRNIDANAQVSLYNISGQLLKTAKATSSEVRFPAVFMKGIYIVRIDQTAVKVVL
jgi:pectin methylesterase-like acyl-CoA thioesterase